MYIPKASKKNSITMYKTISLKRQAVIIHILLLWSFISLIKPCALIAVQVIFFFSIILFKVSQIGKRRGIATLLRQHIVRKSIVR